MIGRGSFGNPWLFERGSAALRGEEIPPLPPLSTRVDEAMEQFELAAALKGEKIAMLEGRKQFSWYLRGVAHATYYKQQISTMSTLEECRAIARGIRRDLR